LRPFFAGTDLELDFGPFAQILEVDLRRKPRAMKENIIGAIVGNDEPEALILKKTSSVPSSGTMNPKPLSLIIFLIVPNTESSAGCSYRYH